MSLQTWKEEFYPIEACEVSEENAIQHSLTKWIGLRKRNLKKHNINVDGDCIEDYHDYDGESFHIDTESCALCCHYLKYSPRESSCASCPLYKQPGNMACDYGENSPYWIWISDNNPEPMIKALRACLKKQKAKVK